MTQQNSLWEHLEQAESKEQYEEQADKRKSQRKSIKRLRASGHWLLLLRVARTLHQPFTLNDVSVALWKAHPEIFSMKGYAYPDNHKVHYILYGTRGLIAKGIIQRLRQGIFRVAEGLELAEEAS